MIVVATAGQWWAELSALNQCFFAAAGFFTLIFIWQFISALSGFGGAELDADVGMGADAADGVDFHGDFHAGDFHADVHGGVDIDTDLDAHSGAETVEAFRIFSIRAVMAFCMLFSWAAALYLENGRSVSISMVLALAWGLAGWVAITLLVHWIKRLAETGNARIVTALGQTGTVYMDIPVGGSGQVRVNVSGTISMISARGAAGQKLVSGTPVRVVRVLDGTTVQVEALDSDSNGGKENNS